MQPARGRRERWNRSLESELQVARQRRVGCSVAAKLPGIVRIASKIGTGDEIGLLRLFNKCGHFSISGRRHDAAVLAHGNRRTATRCPDGLDLNGVDWHRDSLQDLQLEP